MRSDKEPIHCGKGILEHIKEEDSFEIVNKPYTEEDLINHFKEICDTIPKPQKELIVIRNGLTDEQIKQIINFKTS